MTAAEIFPLIVAITTWLTPSPAHAEGLLVRYCPADLVEQVAAFRGYDLSPYRDRCGVSLISPADLGRVVWLRVPGGEWYGPCLAMDAANRAHFHRIVYRNREVAEVPNALAARFGFCCGAPGEIYIGRCPPDGAGEPREYRPPLALDAPDSYTPSMWPYPAQELPRQCGREVH